MSIRRQLRVAGLAVAVIAAALGMLYLVYWLTAGRPLLSGEHRHDFGVLEMAGHPLRLTHTFVLANPTSRTLQVQDVKSTCNCTVASVSTRSIEPGGEISIEASMSLTNDGRKAATVTLVCGDDGTESLHLSAAVRMRQRLDVPAQEAPLAPGKTLVRALQYADYDSDETPPRPEFSAPEGVTVTVGDWAQYQKRQASLTRPAMWRAQMQITQSAIAGAPPVGSLIAIRVGADQHFDLPIVPVAVGTRAPPPPELPPGVQSAPPWAPTETPAGSAPGGR